MGFPGGHAGSFFHQGRVKGPGLRNGDGVRRAVAVDHVQPEKQRDAQPALLHGNLLQLIGLGRVLHHQGADSPGADLILVIVLLGGTHNFFELGIGKPPVGDHLDELAKGDLKSPTMEGDSWFIWPIFSSRVISASRLSILSRWAGVSVSILNSFLHMFIVLFYQVFFHTSRYKLMFPPVFSFVKTGRLEQTARFLYGNDEKYLRSVMAIPQNSKYRIGQSDFSSEGTD